MRIGILQCGHFATEPGYPKKTYHDLYSEMLSGRDLTFRTWSVVDMEFPKSVHEAEGWLISGSKHGVYDDLPFIAPLEDFVRKIYAAQVPLVGICFGHQIMAQALGGKTEKFSGGWSVGRVTYDFGEDALSLNAWHQDQVIQPPPGATTIASTDFCAHAGLAYDGKAYSIQPHPEFEPQEVEMLLKSRAPGVVPDDIIETALSTNGMPTDNEVMADRIAAFFKEARDG